jgi:hypothetical protein
MTSTYTIKYKSTSPPKEKYASVWNVTNIIIYLYKWFSRALLPYENQGVTHRTTCNWLAPPSPQVVATMYSWVCGTGEANQRRKELSRIKTKSKSSPFCKSKWNLRLEDQDGLDLDEESLRRTPKPFPYTKSPIHPFLGAPNLAVIFFASSHRRRAKFKMLELHRLVKEGHRSSLLPPYPLPWTEAHRSKPPPVTSKQRRRMPPLAPEELNPPPRTIGWEPLVLPLHFAPEGPCSHTWKLALDWLRRGAPVALPCGLSAPSPAG